MTRAPWTTPEQHAWLEALLPAFVEAQQTKTTSTIFFPKTHKDWQEKFPMVPPTQEEVKAANGETAVAVAKKRKFWEDVWLLFYLLFGLTRLLTESFLLVPQPHARCLIGIWSTWCFKIKVEVEGLTAVASVPNIILQDEIEACCGRSMG